ncbi:hypothetical protein MauCBS54593_007790 [Microsporum audouinii]
MSPLWGLRHNGREEGQDEDFASETGNRDRRMQDADERTRLLPAERNGYLHPDDPAVSPYNIWGVRALRGLTLTVLFISLLWWILLLISIFVSPPGMSNRGSGFSDFSFTTLTISNLLIALIFFAIPSTPMTIWASSLSVLLSVSLFLTLGVPRLRVEEGWIGIASAAWAMLISLYLVAQTQVVARSKKEEEERLTGREETRRSLGEWFAILLQVVIMAVTILVGILLMSTLSLRAKDATLQAPGQRYYVDDNKYQVHLHCIGERPTSQDGNDTAVTVLLEGGEAPVEYTFQNWVDVAYQHGVIKRYCYWDRPGVAWSDNAPSPHSAGMSADALSEALAMADEEGPWIVVSAGVGGIYSRIFASRHIRDIRGMMLIDTLHEDLLHTLGKPSRGLKLWIRGILSPLGIDRLAGAIFKGRTRADRVCGMRAYQGGKFIKAQLQESLVADSITSSEISSARHIQSPSTPLVVISSGREVRRSQTWADKQEDLTKVTNNLVAWDIVKGAPHEVWDTLDGRRTLEKRLEELMKKAES